MDEEAPENGAARWRPTLPWTIVAVAAVVAVVAVSGLLLVLFQRTVGPGEVLRDFSRKLQDGDCGGTYALLDPKVTEAVPQDEWCDALPAVADALNPDFSIEDTRLRQEVARLRVSGDKTTRAVWLMRRSDRSWLVRGARGIPFPGR